MSVDLDKSDKDLGDPNFLIDCYPNFGNSAMVINCRFRGPRTLRNCDFVPVTIDGWPHVAVITTKKIKKEQQLFTDYGKNYWDGSKQLSSWQRYSNDLPVRRGVMIRKTSQESTTANGPPNVTRVTRMSAGSKLGGEAPEE